MQRAFSVLLCVAIVAALGWLVVSTTACAPTGETAQTEMDVNILFLGELVETHRVSTTVTCPYMDPCRIERGDGWSDLETAVNRIISEKDAAFNSALGLTRVGLPAPLFSANWPWDPWLRDAVLAGRESIDLSITIGSSYYDLPYGGGGPKYRLTIERRGELGYFIVLKSPGGSMLTVRAKTLDLPAEIPVPTVRGVMPIDPVGDKETQIAQLINSFLSRGGAEPVVTFSLNPDDLEGRVVFAAILQQALKLDSGLDGMQHEYAGSGYTITDQRRIFSVNSRGGSAETVERKVLAGILYQSKAGSVESPSFTSREIDILGELVRGDIYRLP